MQAQIAQQLEEYAYPDQPKHRVHPFQEGFAFFEVGMNFPSIGHLLENCPYQPGTEEANQWVSGFYSASEHLDWTLGISTLRT